MTSLNSILCVLAALALSACATVEPRLPAAAASAHGGAFMAHGEAVAAPSGFVELCRREIAACAPAGAAAEARMALDAARLAELGRVNDEVNRRIAPMDDARAYGVAEHWVDPLAGRLADGRFTASGDCEDFALAKRDLLLAAGWPREALFLAVGYHRTVGLHAVLIARTDRGDLVLDSRSPWIEAWTAAPYVWVKRQVSATSGDWVRPYADVDLARAAPDEAATTAAVGATARPHTGS